jgi:hypothetical protein
MRMMLKFHLDTETANLAINDGSLAATLGRVFADCRPEAVYFLTEDGRRTGHVYFEMTSPDQVPRLAEPLFQAMNATVDFIPVMNQAELETGLQAWASTQK